MRKARKTVFAALFAALLALCVAAACSDKTGGVPMTPEDPYTFTNPSATVPEMDAGFTLDGVLDEAAYTAQRGFSGVVVNDQHRAEVKMPVVFGEKGLYFGFDVTETTRIYYNPARTAYYNSIVELYLAVEGTTSIDGLAFEIDLTPVGELFIRRANGNHSYSTQYAPPEVSPVLKAVTKGGPVNTEDCHGYTLEFFMPYSYFGHLGMENPESIRDGEIYVNVAHITSFSYDDTKLSTARYWYGFGSNQLTNYSWGDPSSQYVFDKNGLHAYDLAIHTTAGGQVTEHFENDYIPYDNLLRLDVAADPGYNLQSIQVNGVERKNAIVRHNGNAFLVLQGIAEDVTVEAVYAPVATATAQMTGTIAYTGELPAAELFGDLEVTFNDGFNSYATSVGTDGAYAVAVPHGNYTLYVRSKLKNTVVCGAPVTVTADRTVDLTVTDGMYTPERFNIIRGSVDLSEQNVGKITPTTGDYFALESVEAFDTTEAALYARIIGTHDRQYSLKFSFDKTPGDPDSEAANVEWSLVYNKNTGKLTISRAPLDAGSLLADWGAVYEFTPAQIAQLRGDGGWYRVIRNGSRFDFYLDDTYLASQTIDVAYATAEMQVTLKSWRFILGYPIGFVLNGDGVSTVTVTENDPAHGEVTFDRSTYAIGDDIVITFVPEADYGLSALTVNGVDRLTDVSHNTLTLPGNRDLSIDVVAAFTALQKGNMTVDVSAYKLGETVSLDGKSVRVVGPSNEYNIPVSGGTLDVGNVAYGTYTLHVEGGFAPVTVTFAGEPLEAHFEYNVFTVKSGTVDLTDQNEKTVTVGGGYFHVDTAEQYGDVMFSVFARNLSSADRPIGIKFTFDKTDGTTASMEWDIVWNSTTGGIQEVGTANNADSMASGFTAVAYFTPAQYAQFNGDGLWYRVVRRGNEFLFYFDDVYVGTRSIDAAYAEQSAYVGFKGWRAPANAEYSFDIADVPSVTVTENSPANGTVEFDKSTYAIGETVTVKLTPAADHVLTGLTVNGVDRLDDVIDGDLTLADNRNLAVNVEATFSPIVRETMTVNVSAYKFGVTDTLAGQSVTVTGADASQTVSVEDGKITVPSLIHGRYTLQVAGDAYANYNTATVEFDGTEETVRFDYQVFTAASDSRATIDWSQQNDGILTPTTDNLYFSLNTTDTYGDGELAVLAKHLNNTFDQYCLKFSFEKEGGGTADVQWSIVWLNNNVAGIRSRKLEEGSLIANESVVYLFTADEYNRYTSGEEWWYRIVRIGNRFLFYLDDRCVGEQTIEGIPAGTRMAMGMKVWNSKKDYDYTFRIAGMPSVTVTENSPANGTVAFDKSTYAIGETVAVTLTPAADYVLTGLTVNGADKLSDVQSNTLTLTGNLDLAIDVVATFSPIVRETMTVNVSAYKMGATDTLAGQSVTVTGAGDPQTVAVTDGKITVPNLMHGRYTLQLAGDAYANYNTATVEFDGTEETVRFDYQVFTQYDGKSVIDLAQQNDNKFTPKNSEYFALRSTDTYGDVELALFVKNLNNADRPFGLKMNFVTDDGTTMYAEWDICWNTSKAGIQAAAQDNQETALPFINWSAVYWLDDGQKGVEYSKFNGDGFWFRLIRTGNRFALYLDDKCVHTAEMDAAYADVKVNLWIKGWKSAADTEYLFRITDAPASSNA